jgi:pheromone a factor receptor
MSLSILIPYLPVMVAFSVYNIMEILPLKPYDFIQVHYGNNPFPWNTVLFVPSSEIGFALMNVNYITILTALPIFWFFGMTKDAINTYRRLLLAMDFGKFFKGLDQEYDPDRRRPRPTGSSAHFASETMSQRLV